MRAQVNLSLLVALSILLCVGLKANAQNRSWYPGRGVSWQPVNAPYTPGPGAIMGGPGNDPNPGSPLYLCRSRYEGSLQPGKWVGGNCNIAYGGQKIVRSSYEVAYGNAVWLRYEAATNGLYQTGTDRDGTPLYSCRVRYRGGSFGLPPSAGLQIQSEAGGKGLKVFGTDNYVSVTGASVAVSQF